MFELLATVLNDLVFELLRLLLVVCCCGLQCAVSGCCWLAAVTFYCCFAGAFKCSLFCLVCISNLYDRHISKSNQGAQLMFLLMVKESCVISWWGCIGDTSVCCNWKI
ncbi:uncharacterized protein [Spinacia oleracea]|uniref:Uncharacterized protein n=1 Tax=Spinacia oleracea TaxID=3562 RepID=A0ABM3QYA4_SPIOL|nr:uncharacterized protein LOC130463259 [Spinacia oleracea]XP_056688320.1 uncharacterized protein LOC130463261 [Spinacia oleracea]